LFVSSFIITSRSSFFGISGKGTAKFSNMSK
jgi:hypothetical protein